MSVNMHIYYKNSSNDEYVPISAQKIFYDYWLPIAAELQLKYVSIFASVGVYFGVNDKAIALELLHELDLMKNHILSTYNVESRMQQDILPRLERLISALQSILEQWDMIIKVSIS